MKKVKTFEEITTRLNDIISELDSGNTPLEEMMKLYREANELTGAAQAILDAYEAELTTVSVKNDAEGAEE